MTGEQAFLVAVELDPRFSRRGAAWPLTDEAKELEELAVSAGCRVIGQLGVRRHRPLAGTFLGRGKLEEIAGRVRTLRAQVVVVNQELSPAQQRNMEELLGVKTIDRTQLILDVFAQRARSQEGTLQVELAQLRYLLPRLTGKGVLLSRLGGGIGTRGPGEQKLEVDRRRIRVRITRLALALEQLDRRRQSTRARRRESQVAVVALVGYTNAGKTTLLNRLTGAVGAAHDQLFTTLDPLARRARLPGGETVILTDTVGFLHQLPHELIEAFKATLEEVREADLLLHVLDASHPFVLEHAAAVEEVLAQLEIREKPVVTILNKRDRVAEPGRLAALERAYQPACAISAATGAGLERFGSLVSERLGLLLVEPVRLRVPADRSDLIALIYRSGHVLHRQESDGVVEMTARVPVRMAREVEGYIHS